MKTKLDQSRIIQRFFLMPLMVCSIFIYSCKSKAQEHETSEHGQEHVEGKGHDSDGDHHGKETKGHDNDENHEKEINGEHGKEHDSTRKGEHGRDVGEKDQGGEDGTELSLNDTYNITKYGVRLVIKYDKASNSFLGTMENTTTETIKKARVEVHLSNGTELGPTTPLNLEANRKEEVELKATEAAFSGWSAHAEIGNLEHGGENDGGEGHDESGEHNKKKEGHR